jgi:hypothetical protein
LDPIARFRIAKIASWWLFGIFLSAAVGTAVYTYFDGIYDETRMTIFSAAAILAYQASIGIRASKRLEKKHRASANG